MANTWNPKRTLLTVDSESGDSFGLAVREDGGYGITQNGQPLPASRFDDHQLDTCLRELLRLGGLIP